MGDFSGEYEATIDAKGRFLLPAGVRKQLPDSGNKFILARGFDNCLVIHTPESWEKVKSIIAELDILEPKVRELRRIIIGGKTDIELDAAGRVLLPPSLKQYAKLEKDITISCDEDRFEIWASNAHKEFFDNITGETVSNLAKETRGMRVTK
jgi:MraZ protein